MNTAGSCRRASATAPRRSAGRTQLSLRYQPDAPARVPPRTGMPFASIESTLPGLAASWGPQSRPASGPADRREAGPPTPAAASPAEVPPFSETPRSPDDYGDSPDRGQTDRQPHPGAGVAPPDDADPPLRGTGGDALPEGEQDRRILPPVQRPGAGRRRLDRRAPRGRLCHHGLSRPWSCPGPGVSAKAGMAELLGK